MNKMDMSEMDDFLERINDVSAEIHAMTKGNDTAEFRKKEKEREIKKAREKAAEQRKEKENYEKKRKGRSGKGEKENYLDYCRFCQWEYELSTPTCLNCGKETMTQKQRYALLLEKAKEYQEKKIKKQEGLKKWDLWKKTQSMLHCKMATNYSKWDYFESSEEEEEQTEPVLPTDNPAFKALEKDLEERSAKRKADVKESEKFKVLGNECLARGEYELAVEKYSLGLSIVRDSKACQLNRALAYMKLNKHKSCIKDCSKILELAELFEEGYTKSAATNFKAFLRRAYSRNQINYQQEALYDIQQALALDPKSKEALKLKEEIEIKIEFNKKQSELRQEQTRVEGQTEGGQEAGEEMSGVQRVQRLAKCQQPEEKELLEVTKLIESNQDLKIVFYDCKGVQQCVQWLKSSLDVCWFINLLLKDNLVIMECFQKCGGLDICLQKVVGTEQIERIDKGAVEEYLQQGVWECLEIVLTCSQVEKVRQWLQNQQESRQLVGMLVQLFRLLQCNSQVLLSLSSVVSNLVYCCGVFNSQIQEKWKEWVEVSGMIFKRQWKSVRMSLVRESVFNLWANLLTQSDLRTLAINDTMLLNHLSLLLQHYPPLFSTHPQYVATLQSLFSLLVNLCYDAPPDAKYLFSQHIQSLLFLFNLQSHSLLLSRGYSVLAKLQPSSIQLLPNFLHFTQELITHQNVENKIAQPVIRLLIGLVSCKEQKEELRKVDKQTFINLMLKLKENLKEKDEQVVCNSCNLGGLVLELLPERQELFSIFTQEIPLLLNIISNSTGNIRKNTAIFTAKLCKDQVNVQVMRDNHGLEILKSVAHLIVPQKQ